MTQRSYNHIILPQQFTQTISQREIPPKKFRPDAPEVNKLEQKQRLLNNIHFLKGLVEDQKKTLLFTEDKTATDIEVEFYTDYPHKFIKKYNLQTYSIEWNKVIWQISTQQLQDEQSAFQQLIDDINLYNEMDKQKSYLWTVKKIEPLSYKKIINKDLYDKLKSEQKIQFDIVLEWNVSITEKKIDYIKSIVWNEDFVWRYTSDSLSFCRIYWTLKDLEELEGKYLWVSSIEPSPQYSVSPSSISLQDTIQKKAFSPANDAVGLVMFEKWVPNLEHELIEDSILNISTQLRYLLLLDWL